MTHASQRLLAFALAAAATVSCSGSNRAPDETPPLPKPPDRPPESTTPAVSAGPDTSARDPWKSFGGFKVLEVKEHVMKSGVAVGFAPAECVLTLTKIEWMEMVLRGKKVREGNAHFRLQKGEYDVPVTISEGRTRTVRGVTIQLVATGEDYDAQRLNYIPWAKVIVDKAAPTP